MKKYVSAERARDQIYEISLYKGRFFTPSLGESRITFFIIVIILLDQTLKISAHGADELLRFFVDRIRHFQLRSRTIIISRFCGPTEIVQRK